MRLFYLGWRIPQTLSAESHPAEALLGGDFAFVGRQRRLRVGDEWYRVDLLFFHRRLRCLVVIDLKLGKLMHADAGQMHLYLNYAREHWANPGENPPVGLILCAQRDATVNDQLKNISQVEHTRHRSLWNFLGNVAAGLIAYTWREKKPSLNIQVKEQFLISN